MQQPTQPGKWFAWTVAVGALTSAGYAASSWFSNLFYVMGPPPSAADHAAFRSDCTTALYILGGSAILGQIATLFASGLQARPNSQTAYWSELHRAASRRPGGH